MKRINRFVMMAAALVLLALILSWFGGSVAATAVSDTNTITQIIPNELETSTHIGNMYISDLTGAPLVLYRVNYPVNADKPEAMARQYLQDNAALLKLQTPNLSDLEYSFLHNGPAGPTVRFNQTVNGIPVYKAVIAVHINNDNMVTYVTNDYKNNINLSSLTPTIAKDNARNIALNYLGVQDDLQLDETQLVIYQLQDQTYLAYLVRLMSQSLVGDWEVIIDAHTGEFLKVFDTSYTYAHRGEQAHKQLLADIHQPSLTGSVPVTGTGTVFDPDPLSSAQATYGDPGFVDGSDANTTQLNGELMTVDLIEIDFTGGLHTLRGPYAEIVDTEAPMNGLFSQASSTFNFNRFDDAFEAVNTYYHIDASMRYINETLGVPIMPFQYSGGARFDPHGLNGADNSHYTPGTGVVAFGEGGVDDAEDSDVIHHELGHGLHDWVTNGSLSQVNGLSEGTGDYWAQSYNRSLGNWTPADPPYHWVFNWDGHNPFWGGRITNYTAVYPGGLIGQIHTDGQIWSTCNMKVYDAIGRIKIDTAMWEGLGMTGSSTNQEQAANAVYQAAIDLGYPTADLQAMHDIYATCVYVVPPVPGADFGVSVTPASLDICVPTNAVYTINVTESNGFASNVILSAVGQPDPPNTVSFSANNQLPPYTSTMTVGTAGASAGSYAIDVVGMSVTTTHTATVQLNLATAAPAATTLVAPADGASGVSATPTFEWTAVANAATYLLEVATDPAFTNIVYSASIAAPDTSHTASNPLNVDTLYYWRVTSANGCGSGTASTVFSFSTGSVYCNTPNLTIPDNNPVGVSDDMVISSDGNITDLNISLNATHTWVGDLIFTLEHVDTGTTATFIDRPGYSGAGFGCDSNNIDVIANDEGPDGDIESQCDSPPAINGDRVGGDPPSTSLLAAFDGESLSGTWRLTASDNAGGDTGTVNEWCIIPTTVLPNAAPVAADDTYTTAKETVLTVAAPGVLANDTDDDGDVLTAVHDSDVTSGTLSFNADGSFTYTPTVGFEGTDSFTYYASDGLDDSNVATVTITVENTAPVAVSDAYTVEQDTILTVAAPGVLANDSDDDGDTLTAVLDSDVTHGNLSLNADGSFGYTPHTGFVGTDSFTYHANDSTDDSNMVMVTITVTAPKGFTIYLPFVTKE